MLDNQHEPTLAPPPADDYHYVNAAFEMAIGTMSACFNALAALHFKRALPRVGGHQWARVIEVRERLDDLIKARENQTPDA